MSEKSLSDSVPEENEELTETVVDEKPKRTRGRRAGAKKSRAQASRENGIKGGIAKKKINEIKKETEQKFDGIEKSAIDELEKLLNPPKEPETTGISVESIPKKESPISSESPPVGSYSSGSIEKLLAEIAGIKATTDKIGKRVEDMHKRKKMKKELKAEIKPEVIPPKEKSPPKKVIMTSEAVDDYFKEMGIKLITKK